MYVRRVSRAGLATVGAVALFAQVAAAAGTAKPRFALDSSRDGFVRLDTQTGAVTHCSLLAGKWVCDAIVAGDSGISARVDALALEVARLATLAAALDSRVTQLAHAKPITPAGLAVQAAPAAAEPAIPAAPTSVTRRIVDRFLVMVRLLKHGGGEMKSHATPS